MRQLLRLLLVCLLSAGCNREVPPAAEGEPRATSGANEVRLSKTAQQAIGLQTAKAERRRIAAGLRAIGWLVPPPGREVVVKAASAGFIGPDGEAFPSLGDEVLAGKSLAALRVFVSPQEQAQLIATKEDADAAIAQADVTMRLIGDQLERYRTAKEAITGSRLVELQEMYDKAQAAYREAKEKLPFLPTEPYRAPLTLVPVKIDSPLQGRIAAVHVAANQYVAAGDPLWTVADWSHLWLRVPIFDVDLEKLAPQQAARVVLAGATNRPITAEPIKSPQTTDPTRRTVDLYYVVSNAQGALRSGQTLPVELATRDVVERTVVPFAAVVWDSHGSTWVYVRETDDEFQRRKVELGARQGDVVAIERGLNAGDEAVVVGAQTLYGEEFKTGIPVDEDD